MEKTLQTKPIRLREHRIECPCSFAVPHVNRLCRDCDDEGSVDCTSDICDCTVSCACCGSQDCRLEGEHAICNACGGDAWDGVPLTAEQLAYAEKCAEFERGEAAIVIDRCPTCNEPAHATESADDETCARCVADLEAAEEHASQLEQAGKFQKGADDAECDAWMKAATPRVVKS